MARKRRRRSRSIRRLRRDARRRGGDEPIDRGYWALVHDLEHAPLTTNLEQLAEIGVEPPDLLCLDEPELRAWLAEIVEGLSIVDVYLRHTDHLDDRTLYSVLCRRVLREPVRDVPAGVGVREWLDLAAGSSPEIWYRYYATEAERLEGMVRGDVVPARGLRVADRDRLLPRPATTRSIR